MAQCKGPRDVVPQCEKGHKIIFYVHLLAASTSRGDVGKKITYWDWPGFDDPIQTLDPDRVTRTINVEGGV